MSDGAIEPSKRQRTGNAPSAATHDEKDNKPLVPDVELLSAWFCPYAQRAWIAMEEKCPGSYTLTESMKVVPPDYIRYEKTPELLDANPNGLVPVIIDRRAGRSGTSGEEGPTVVYESLICVEYADEALGSGPTLLPGSPARRAECRMWADYCNKYFSSPFYRLMMKKTDEERAEAADKLLETLRTFSERCVGPFFFGEEFTLVDVALAPWAVGPRMELLKHYRGFTVPKTEEYAKYHEWTEAVLERPSFKATACDDMEAMIRVYRRYALGTAQSKVGDAVRSGTAMP